MTKVEVFEGQRVIHVRNGHGTVVDIGARHAAVVKVSFDNGDSRGVWLADLTFTDE